MSQSTPSEHAITRKYRDALDQADAAMRQIRSWVSKREMSDTNVAVMNYLADAIRKSSVVLFDDESFHERQLPNGG